MNYSNEVAGQSPVSPQEVERRSQNLVSFNGNIHHALNLQDVPNILGSLQRVNSLYPGKTTLIYEYMFANPDYEILFNAVIENLGPGKFIPAIRMSAETGSRISQIPQQEIDARLEGIERADGDIDRILREGLLAREDIQDYFLFKGFSRIPNLEIKFEAADQETFDRVMGFVEEAGVYGQQAPDAWLEGQFDAAIALRKKEHEVMTKGSVLREPNLAGRIKTVLADSHERGEKRGVQVIQGLVHAQPTLSELKRQIAAEDPDLLSSTSFEDNSSIYHQPYMLLEKETREGKLTDETAAREIAYIIMQQFMEQALLADGQVTQFAQNYMALDRAFASVVNGLSLNDLRGLCESRTDLLSFFVSHPVGRSLFP